MSMPSAQDEGQVTGNGKMVNSLGLPDQTGGNYFPIIKINTNAANMSIVDKDSYGQSQQRIVPLGTALAYDSGSMQRGYAHITVTGPKMEMTAFGQPVPTQPEELDSKGRPIFKPAVCLLCAGAAIGGIRQLLITAANVMQPFVALWDAISVATEAAAGKIPEVAIAEFTPVVTGSGAQRATYYRPKFIIQSWVNRDEIPGFGPRTVPPPPWAEMQSAKPAAPAVMTIPKVVRPALVDDEIPF